jgi:colicin import membrane protein
MAEQEKEVRIRPNLEKYVKGVSGSGKRTLRTNDPIAAALDGFTLDEVYAVASKMTEITQKDLKEKYGHLNIGMQRMNLGNRIRGVVAKLDKAHAEDNKVASGLATLELECRKPRDAANARAKAAEKAAADRAAKAEEKAKAEEAKGKAKAKGKTKAA